LAYPSLGERYEMPVAEQPWQDLLGSPAVNEQTSNYSQGNTMHIGLRSRTLKGLRRVAALWHASNELEKLVATHTGLVMNKWKHYFEIYDRHLARFREREITLLEVGVGGGGSLQMWRRYFGPKARIFGLDVNPECKRFASPGTEVFIGSQRDLKFLQQLAGRIGPIDILIDDGSHTFEDQLTTFRAMFNHIRNDGVYACEDLCSSYWREEFEGGVRKQGTYVEFLKGLIDELNAWFWREHVEKEQDAFAKLVHGIHFYPALVVIEKRRMETPIVAPVGRTSQTECPSDLPNRAIAECKSA
jgi:hypothetical protein